MSLEQQIEELRAELRSITDRKELRQIEAELRAAVDALARLDTAAEALPG